MSWKSCCEQASDAVAADSVEPRGVMTLPIIDDETPLAGAAVAPPAGGAAEATGAAEAPPDLAEPPLQPAVEAAVEVAAEAVAAKDVEAAEPAPVAQRQKTSRSPGQEALRTDQKHPNAVLNVVSTLKPRGTWCGLVCRILLAIPVLAVLLPVILLKVVILLLVLPLWCLARRSLLRCVGEEARSNFEPAYMLPSSSGLSTSVPDQLRGVFYMRNNPMDDDLVCMERGTWDEGGMKLHLPVYIARTWSFKEKFITFALLVAVRLLRYRYVCDFTRDGSGNLNEATIRLRLFCFTVPLSILHFGMTDVSKDKDGSLWERWSLLFGMPMKSYWLERIMDTQGNPTKYWEHVKDEVPEKCLCIAC